jgi:hypothetical protein
MVESNIMNKFKRRKLGLTQSDAKTVVSKAFDELDEAAPISKKPQSKDFAKYSTQNLKTINIGTLRKPVEQLAIYDSSVEAYFTIKAENKPRFYAQSNYKIVLNEEILNYTTNIKVDQNNPYDPLFSSFDRLYSLRQQNFTEGGLTGIRLGEKQKFFNIMQGFSKSSVINVFGAGTNLNGSFTPTSQIVNGRPRFLNASLAFPADITWSSTLSGWVMNQTTIPGRITFGLASVPRYFLNSTSELPTGDNWSVTGRINVSGSLPVPTSTQKDLEGFFKLATSRKSSGKNKIYAIPNNSGLTVDETTGSLIFGNSWVTYPHTYNVESFPAFKYPVSLTMDKNSTGVSDLLVISTGIRNKNIIYVSPHSVEQFQGFWAEQAPSNRQPLTGQDGKIINNRNIWVLASGNLITVSSENTVFTGLTSQSLTGESGISFIDFYNFDNAILKQTTPLSQTNFYKLYEPLYRQNSIHTGTWNGIIPSGVPFSIETIRTKNSEMVCPTLKVHVHNSFLDVSPSGSGSFQFLRPFEYENLAGFGNFEGYSQNNSNKSRYEAEYIAMNKSKSKAKAKLKGYLWEKGLTVDNSKVKKIIRLFGTPVSNSGVSQDTPRYCLPYDNPSDPASCSYTGEVRGLRGIVTSAGLRLVDKNSTFVRNVVDEDGNLIKFIPIIED